VGTNHLVLPKSDEVFSLDYLILFVLRRLFKFETVALNRLAYALLYAWNTSYAEE